MRTREHVAASLNIGWRRMDAITVADLCAKVSRGMYASLDEAVAEWMVVADHDPRMPRPCVSADAVDAHLAELYAGLRRQFENYQRVSGTWTESLRVAYFSEMHARQEWLMAMQEQLGAELDHEAVRAAEEDIERDMTARARAARDAARGAP